MKKTIKQKKAFSLIELIISTSLSVGILIQMGDIWKSTMLLTKNIKDKSVVLSEAIIAKEFMVDAGFKTTGLTIANPSGPTWIISTINLGTLTFYRYIIDTPEERLFFYRTLLGSNNFAIAKHLTSGSFTYNNSYKILTTQLNFTKEDTEYNLDVRTDFLDNITVLQF